jgi:hypothetical protein
MKQLPIDFTAARLARDEGITRSSAHAERLSAGWNAGALDAVRLYALRNAEFQSDDVRAWAHAELELPLPPDARAWGGVMVRARRAAIVAPTDRFQPGKAAICHMHPKRVWRSLLHAAPP